MLDISHLTFSSHGGAGSVASLLHHQQKALGHNSTLITLTNSDLRSKPFENPALTIRASLDQYMVRGKHAASQVSLFRNLSNSSDELELKDSESILNFHWVNGFVKFSDIQKASHRQAPTVWTLHDAWPFTGACHQPDFCTKFEADCRGCPQVRSIFQKKVELSLKAKKELRFGKNFVIVTPSEQMLNLARSSSLFSNCRFRLIHNPVDRIFFEEAANDGIWRKKTETRRQTFVVVVVASNLDDPNKGVEGIISAFLRFTNSVDADAKLWLVGNHGKNFEKLDRRVVNLGSLSSLELAQVYSEADLHVSNSNAESFSLTVAEASAKGLNSLVKKGTAVQGIYKNVAGVTIFGNDSDLTANLLGKYGDFEDGRNLFNNLQLVNFAKLNFEPTTVAQAYIDLYQELISNRSEI